MEFVIFEFSEFFWYILFEIKINSDVNTLILKNMYCKVITECTCLIKVRKLINEVSLFIYLFLLNCIFSLQFHIKLS